MTPDQVAELQEADLVRFMRSTKRPAPFNDTVVLPVRGRVTQLTDNFIRVDWVTPFKAYDILRRSSPLWAVIELERGYR